MRVRETEIDDEEGRVADWVKNSISQGSDHCRRATIVPSLSGKVVLLRAFFTASELVAIGLTGIESKANRTMPQTSADKAESVSPLSRAV